MSGIGFTEILLLALLGLLVLGPRRLPEVARTAGALIGRARSAWQDLRRELQQEMDSEHNRRIMEEAEKFRKDLEGPLDDGKEAGDGRNQGD